MSQAVLVSIFPDLPSFAAAVSAGAMARKERTVPLAHLVRPARSASAGHPVLPENPALKVKLAKMAAMDKMAKMAVMARMVLMASVAPLVLMVRLAPSVLSDPTDQMGPKALLASLV